MSRWARRGSRSAVVAALACVPLALLGPAASAQTFPPLAWTKPVTVEHAPFAHGHVVTAVSCASASFCVVGDDVGNIFTSTDPASTTGSWKAAAISPGHRIGFLTCPATGFCVALVTVKGRQLIFTSVRPAGGRRAWAVARAPMVLRAISCPAIKLCVGAGKGAIVTSTDPTAGPDSVWKVTSFGPQLRLTHITGVSCPRPTFCVAGDDAGNVYTSRNPAGGKSAWQITFVTTAAFLPVSCPSASFCAAALHLGGVDDVIYSTNPAGGAPAWHQVGGLPGGNHRGTITCTSATFCVVAAYEHDNHGELFFTTDLEGGTPWQLVQTSEPSLLSTVTCISPQFCVAGDLSGDVVSSADPGGGLQAWNTVNITGFTAIVSLDCPFAALCLAGDDGGNILTSTNAAGGASAWHTAKVEPPPNPRSGLGIPEVDGFSCPTVRLCVAVDDQGNVLWSTNPAGGTTAWTMTSIDTFDGPGTRIDSVACPSRSLCVAGDAFGNLLTSTNPTGGTTAWQLASLGPNPRGLFVTCPTASLCLASGGQTIFASTNPAGGASTWHPTVNFGPNATIGPITCPSPSSCVAIGVYAFQPNVDSLTIFSSRHPTGGILGWNFVSPMPGSGPGGPDPSDTAITCPSAGFCMAGFVPCCTVPGEPASSEFFASFEPASGKASAWQSAGLTADAVSCPSPSLCVAGNISGQIQIGIPRASTSTTLRLSAKRIAYGREQGERLTVTVRPKAGAVPTGTVVISAGAKTICTLRRLRHGTASCTLTPKQLRPGTYRLTARYSGSRSFLSSTSAAKVLTVFRPGTFPATRP